MTDPKPVKMWAVVLDDGSHMTPPAIDETREEAMALAVRYTTTNWKTLVTDYGYRCIRVTITPDPAKDSIWCSTCGRSCETVERLILRFEGDLPVYTCVRCQAELDAYTPDHESEK